MRLFYLERFNVQSTVLFGPADVEGASSERERSGGPIRLCYFGALWKWQEDAVDKLINVSENVDFSLDIYTFHEVKESIRLHPRVNMKEPLAAHEVKGAMGLYDGVVIPFGFHDDVRPLSALNISTKLSECLASGVPVVLIGPSYGAMTEFANRYECAIVLSDTSDPHQVQSFCDSFTSRKREELLKNARWVSENVTCTSVMRRTWRNAMKKWQDGAGSMITSCRSGEEGRVVFGHRRKMTG